jgi:hypothetical protein
MLFLLNPERNLVIIEATPEVPALTGAEHADRVFKISQIANLMIRCCQRFISGSSADTDGETITVHGVGKGFKKRL